ncbi:MAG: nucleotidyl transferase AbiEii/AbiGii toxin family protein [Anaerolineales bacterium]|nr:nucleotidyl transferase AbiEii/AbiGii toxin family protein [Anaerolineales bacterium]
MESLILKHPHWNALTPATQDAFRLLNKLEMTKRFYLAGGTGLALHFGHRYSIDLDFFSDEPTTVGPDERSVLRTILNDPTLEITYDTDSTFVATWREVGISFFRLDLYPLVQPTLLVENVRLATVEEIGAMKFAAIINRGTRKDMVDLYFILQQVSLDALFQVASIKYAKVRSFPVNAIRALSYFDDAESLPMPQMLDKTPWSKMKKFLEAKSVEAGRKQLADLWES